ncbi:hypothetical protein Tco_0286403 [Tanacetum coccineum]
MFSEEEPKVVRKNDDAPIIEERVSDDKEEDVSEPKIEKKIVRPSIVKKEFVKSKQQENSTRKTAKQVEQHRQNTYSPRGNQRNWNNMMSQKLGSNFEMFNKTGYVCGSFDHLQVDCNYHQKLFQNQRMVKPVWKSAQRGSHILIYKIQDLIHSGMLKAMTRNIPILPNYEAIDGGSDEEKKVENIPRKDSECNDQEKEDNVNNTNTVNVVGTNKVNAVGGKTSIELPFDPNRLALEDYSIFDISRDDEDDGEKADMNNLDTTIQVLFSMEDEEEVMYVQPPGFDDRNFPDRVYKGLQVQQKKDGIFISQDKYVIEILKKFGFIEVKTARTPMETQKPLLKNEDGEEVEVYMYRSMIGSLMYLTSSRPDFMFAVCVCARYQVNPKVSHLYAVKRIFRYLKGQPKLGLWYPKDSPFDLVAYTDSDYARASLDRKSTTRGCQFLRCRLISRQSKKQTVSTSVVKTIDGEVQLHALVDGKKIIISEASVRRDLKLEDEEGQNENVIKKVVDAAQVSTATTTVTITNEEITLAQALEALKTSKPKSKGITIEEPVKPMKKKDQISFDEEVALKLQAEFDEEERLAREKVEKEKEANIALIEE